MPIELQQQVQAMVTETKGRSGWPARQTLRPPGHLAVELLSLGQGGALGDRSDVHSGKRSDVLPGDVLG